MTSYFSEKRSTILPFPSSPHCVPNITSAGIFCSLYIEFFTAVFLIFILILSQTRIIIYHFSSNFNIKQNRRQERYAYSAARPPGLHLLSFTGLYILPLLYPLYFSGCQSLPWELRYRLLARQERLFPPCAFQAQTKLY